MVDDVRASAADFEALTFTRLALKSPLCPSAALPVMVMVPTSGLNGLREIGRSLHHILSQLQRIEDGSEVHIHVGEEIAGDGRQPRGGAAGLDQAVEAFEIQAVIEAVGIVQGQRTQQTLAIIRDFAADAVHGIAQINAGRTDGDARRGR